MGAFDDLIPSSGVSSAPTSGAFDDLIPVKQQPEMVRKNLRGGRSEMVEAAPRQVSALSMLPDDVASQVIADNPVRTSGRGIGNTEAREKAAKIEGIRLENPYLADLIENTTGYDAALIGAGSGLTNIGRAVGLADQPEGIEKQAIEGLRDQSGAFVAGEVAGESAPFLAVGGPITGLARTTTQKALAGAALGATEGGLVTKGRGGSAKDIVTGAVLGTALGGIIPMAGAGANRLRSGVVNEVAEEIPESLRRTQQGARSRVDDLDDATLGEFFEDPNAFFDMQDAVRKQAFERLDVTPTRAQITRDPKLFQEQVDVFRDAEKTNLVRRRLVEQEKILTDRVNGEIDAMGGVSARAPSSVVDTIVGRSLELDAAISSLYKEARAAAPKSKNVRFSNTAAELRRNAPIDARSDGTVRAMRGEMKNQGFLDPKGNPTRLTSVEAAENIRAFANTLFDGANPVAKKFLRDIKDAIDDDVFSASGDDFFNRARSAKREFMQGLESSKGHKFDTRKKSLVKDVLEGVQQPDDIVNKITGRRSQYKAKEVRELREYLLSGSPEHVASGARAWNDVRSAALEQIKDSAFRGPLNELGTKSLSRSGLQGALESIGPDKIRILFTPDEIGFLRDLAKVSVYKEPVAGVRPTPSKPALEKIENTIKQFLPLRVREWLPEVSEGMISKAKEKELLDLATRAETIAAQSERSFKKRIQRAANNAARSSKQTATAAPAALAVPIAAEEQEQ